MRPGHSLMRSVSKLLDISDVARDAGQVPSRGLTDYPGHGEDLVLARGVRVTVRVRVVSPVCENEPWQHYGNNTRSHDFITHINRRASYGRTSRSVCGLATSSGTTI